MPKSLMTSCGSSAMQWSRRDAWLGALAMIGGSVLFAGAGIVAKRVGIEAMSEALADIGLPASLLFMTPLTYPKDRCWRTQVLLVGLPLLVLVSIDVLTQIF
jgi:drug/metabolite transporter (DMT)-like permease